MPVLLLLLGFLAIYLPSIGHGFIKMNHQLPYDAISVGVMAVAAGLLASAAVVRGTAVVVRVMLVLVAASAIRVDAAWQHSLHRWDEQFHALVAKNLITDPLKPTLYRRPMIEYDYRDWTANHIWLHKPPGALWIIAASMRVFGINDVALRLPSVLLGTGAVLLTFLIGRLLWNERVGLLAAGFQSVNGFLVALSSGRRASDHVDTALIFFVELGIWLVLKYQRERRTAWLLVSALSVGAGMLVKLVPALLIVAVALTLFIQTGSWSTGLRRASVMVLIAAVVIGPWMVHIRRSFPREAAWEGLYAVMHVSQTLEGQEGTAFGYIRDLPRFFGELVWISLIGAVCLARGARKGDGEWPALVWAATPYIVFSMMKTQMPGYVMIGAPAIFLLQARFWCWLRDRVSFFERPWLRWLVAMILGGLAILPGRYLLEPTGVFERRDRNPAITRELRSLRERIGLTDAVIFNVPSAIEAMFYSPYIAYERMPTAEDVQRIANNGVAIFIFQPAGRTVTVPQEWPVTVLPQLVR